MKYLPLDNGQLALVSDEDFDRFKGLKWKLNPDGYVRCGMYLHREVMNAPKGREVDHRDGNKLNNTPENLRFATRQQNNQNIRKRAGMTSKYKGVSFKGDERRKQPWVAQIYVDGKKKCLGVFAEERHAAMAYDVAARDVQGEFARLNFPEAIHS